MMMAEELVQQAGLFYPKGFPPAEDDEREPELAFQRTPEYQRWIEAWDAALKWEKWTEVLSRLDAIFPHVGEVSQPYMSACLRCCVYLERPHAPGGRHVTRVVGAVSILAPLYLVYVTTQILEGPQGDSRPEWIVSPVGEARACMETLAQHLEQELGYKPFPAHLVDVPLAGLRIVHLTAEMERPTLLNAFFGESLANLP